jgi:hypothetical protein
MRCLLTRWAISRAADDGAAVAERPRRHIDGCVDCEAFERRVEWLGRSLDAGRAAAPAPAEPRTVPRHLVAAGLVAAGAIAVALTVGDGERAPAVEPVVAESGEDPGQAEPEPPRLDVESLATDAERGIRYMLRVSGLPEPR